MMKKTLEGAHGTGVPWLGWMVGHTAVLGQPQGQGEPRHGHAAIYLDDDEYEMVMRCHDGNDCECDEGEFDVYNGE